MNVIRFAEDFIVTGRAKDLLEEEVKPPIEPVPPRARTRTLGRANPYHPHRGRDGLPGLNLRKCRGTLLIKLAKQNVQAFLAKVRGIVKAHQQVPAGTLVRLLNPMTRGWAGFHHHVVSKHTCRAVDQAIFHTL